MKAVFLDEVGQVGKVDQEFRQLWSALRTPLSSDQLAEELKAGQSSCFSVIKINY